MARNLNFTSFTQPIELIDLFFTIFSFSYELVEQFYLNLCVPEKKKKVLVELLFFLPLDVSPTV